MHEALHAAVVAALDEAPVGGRPDDRADERTASGAHDGAEHRLELGLRLGEFGDRIAVGDDAAAGHEPGRVTVGGEFGAADGDRPRAVANASTQPTAPPYRPRSNPSTRSISSMAARVGARRVQASVTAP